MKAHQRLIKEKLRKECEGDLFGKWWLDIDTTVTTGEVKVIDYNTAKPMVLENEWMGTMPLAKGCRFIYGIYYEGHLGGAAVYVEPASKKYTQVFPRKVVQLNRGCCAFWTERNTASYFLAKTFKLLRKEGVIMILAYCTREAGEIGRIYQALGFKYLGTTTPSRMYWLDGRYVSQRTMSDKIAWAKKAKKPEFLKAFQEVPSKKIKGKYRYIKLIGNRKENQEAVDAFRITPLPYPRAV